MDTESTQNSEDFSNESSSDLRSPTKVLANSKWTVDYAFKSELAKMGASEDPQDWSPSQVLFWVSFKNLKNFCFRFFPIIYKITFYSTDFMGNPKI